MNSRLYRILYFTLFAALFFFGVAMFSDGWSIKDNMRTLSFTKNMPNTVCKEFGAFMITVSVMFPFRYKIRETVENFMLRRTNKKSVL